MTRLRQLEDLLFREGWGFFVPYLLVYVVCWAVDAPTLLVRNIFVAIHVLTLALLADFSWRNRASIRRGDFIFWSAVVLFVLVPGAYLEFPGDSWEHFRRIFAWQTNETINSNLYANRMAYFWGWTTMFWLEPIDRRLAIDLYSAFWQVMLLIQFRAFLQRLGVRGPWLYLQLFALLALFGHNLFGIRYYALSSTPLAYLAYFRFLAILQDALTGGPKRFLAGGLLYLLISFNHRQEQGLVFLSSCVLIAFHLYERLSTPRRRQVLFGLGAIGALGVGYGIFVRQLHPETLFHVGANSFSFFGSFRPWSDHGAFRETLGTHGILGLLLALGMMRYKEQRLLALLSLSPILAILFPPSAMALSTHLTASMDAYRLLYALPMSVALVSGLGRFLPLAAESRRFGAACLLIFVLSLPVNYPWRGRLAFQLKRSSPERSLLALDQTAQWLSKNRKFDRKCTLLSDNLTRFIISAHLGIDEDSALATGELVRLSKSSPGRARLTDVAFTQFQQGRHVCGVLIAHSALIQLPVDDAIGNRSGHWPTELADQKWQTTPEFEQSDEMLLRAGWKKTEVPPYYTWYDPPGT